jgi:hypothetical protein
LDIQGFISTNEIASGAGLWRAVAENPTGMGFFDEISTLFIRQNAKGGTDALAEGKNLAVMDLYSRSGQRFVKSFGDSKNNVEVNYPCVSIIGNATPVIYDSITIRDSETGLLQRFDFWSYGGKIKKKPLIIGSEYKLKTNAWIGDLRRIMQAMPTVQNLATLINGCIELDATDEAISKMGEYSDYIVSEANKATSEGEVGFISRRFDSSLKYGLIHHAAINGHNGLYKRFEIESMLWGIELAEMLSKWKINTLMNRVVAGDFHKNCETFKQAILMATKAGRSATFKYMASRRAALKDWSPKQSEDIIKVLTKRREIVAKDGRDGVTVYYLTKENQEDK